MLKVLHVTPFFIPTKEEKNSYDLRTFEFAGGAESYVFNLSRALTKAGHSVKVFTLNLMRNEMERLFLEDVFVQRFPCTRHGKIALSARLFRRLVSENADIVHAVHVGHPLTLEAGIACRISGKPFLITHVGTRKFLPFAYLSARIADRIIIPTMFSFPFFAQLGVSHKTVVIPHGVNNKRFHPHLHKRKLRKKLGLGGAPIILFVGRLRWHKGLKHLINAMPSVLQSVPDAKLLVVGEGEQRFYLQELVKKLCIKSNVFFTGFVGYKELPLYYACSDLFVLPSVTADNLGHHYPETEAFGIVLLEAMASGLPVVATRVGGVNFVIDSGKTGFLVEEGDSSRLADRVVQLLLDKDLSEKLKENALRLVEGEYSWDIVVKEMLRVFHQASRV